MRARVRVKVLPAGSVIFKPVRGRRRAFTGIKGLMDSVESGVVAPLRAFAASAAADRPVTEVVSRHRRSAIGEVN